MKETFEKNKLDKIAKWFLVISIITILVLMPFHATITVWLSQTFGHYMWLRLWKEFILAVQVVVALYFFVRFPKLRSKLTSKRLTWLIIIYVGITLLMADISFVTNEVSVKALAYGTLLNLRFLAFFLVCWIATELTDVLKRWWQWILLLPAGIVIAFGLIQHFFLPYDFLKHLGYSLKKNIGPYQAVDNKLDYVRIQSTLAGPNPFGTYLVLIGSALFGLVTRNSRDRLIWPTFLFAVLLALFFSYSRGALIGLFLAVGSLIYFVIRSNRVRYLVGVGILLVVFTTMGLAFALRNNDFFQNAIFHTDEHSLASESSNFGHLEAMKDGARDMIKHPLGEGPGSAGPASRRNELGNPKIAENYFIQIGQEVGWLGLIVFILINFELARMLYRKRNEALALILLASLVGITFVNLLSHAWTDDTLAYIWWGLAGVAVAGNQVRRHYAKKAS